MKKKTHRKYVALLTMFAMVICTIFCTNTVKADTRLPWDESNVLKTCSFIFNNEERSLILLKNNACYLKIGSSEPSFVSLDIKDTGFDKYGTIWCIYLSDNAICWKNNDLLPGDMFYHSIKAPTAENPDAYVNNAECLVLDDQGFVTGYKDLSDEIHPILTLEEMKKILNISDDPTPTPTAPTPTNTPTNTEKPVITPKPTASPQPTVAPKVSIKKSSGYTCLSVGNKVVSKHKLKKGVLTWKGTKKNQKVKQVKQAGFIKKSKNLVYITKKGKAYTISQKGKKKTIVKKDAKSFVKKNGFVIKIKKKSGYVNVVNR